MYIYIYNSAMCISSRSCNISPWYCHVSIETTSLYMLYVYVHYMCIYICTYVCVKISVYIKTSLCRYMYTHIYIYIYIYVYVYACVYTYMILDILFYQYDS